MSSSSSATDGSVAGLLAESLEVLAAELPPAYERTCALLAGRSVEIRVDEERLVVSFARGRAEVRPAGAGEALEVDARVVTTRRAITDVIDARRSIAEAVLADEVEVIGALDRLSELHAGLVAYLHGAVRCPSFPGLLGRFRAGPGVISADPPAAPPRV